MPVLTVLLVAGANTAAAASTVQDLLGQTLQDLDIIVLGAGVDDLAGLAAQDGRITIVPPEAGPPGHALNRGLALAQGELVLRAIPGDGSTPDRLERQAGLLRTMTEVAFVGAGWRAVDAVGNVTRVTQPPAHDAALRAAMASGDAIGHPTAILRREAAVAAGGWRPAFVGKEDYDLLLRLLDRNTGVCSSEPLVDYAAADPEPGWRQEQQLILSELAAIAAHDRRQAGRPDHGDQDAAADRGLLHRMGMADEEITRHLASAAVTAAISAGRSARWRAMREAAQLGLRQPGLTHDARSQLRSLWIRGLARRPPPEVRPC